MQLPTASPGPPRKLQQNRRNENCVLFQDKLQFLYDEWAHPYFISKEEYARLLEGTGECKQVCHMQGERGWPW